MPMDEGSDERHHVYECPEAGDAAIESHGRQSIVLYDAEECVDGNCAYEYATCEISSGNKPKLPSVSTSSDHFTKRTILARNTSMFLLQSHCALKYEC